MGFLEVKCTVKESESDVANLKELHWYNTTNLHTLAAADKWYIDGNFAMVPLKFLQLYVRDSRVSERGDYPIGVCIYRKQNRSNMSQISSPLY